MPVRRQEFQNAAGKADNRTGARAVGADFFTTRAGADALHLRILATSDLHMHVHPWDYYADRPAEGLGLARIADLAAEARAEAVNVLMLDNGDFLQGNPMGDHLAARGLAEDDLHPMIAAMNAAGYDAATIGNHEFNYGLDFLTRALRGAAFPFVSANLATRLGRNPAEDRTLLPPYTILDRDVTDAAGRPHRLRIGVLGLAPPQVLVWDRQHLEHRLAARDMVEAARAFVPRMQAEGCDLIVALAHCGIGPPDHRPGMENAALPLARIDGIDALVLGHSHLVFPGPDYQGLPGADATAGRLLGKPAVMPGAWGSHLGVIDLALDRRDGRWQVRDHAVQARALPEAPARPGAAGQRVLDATCAAHEETLAFVRQAVGHSRQPLHSYFALVSDAPSVRIVAEAQREYVARMLTGTAHADLPILSAAAPFKTGGRGGPLNYTDVAAGALAIRNVADLYIYPNQIRAVRVTGAELRDWIERAAGVFRQVVPGRADQPLLDPDFASYNFDVIAGACYEIDLSQPPRFGPDGQLLNPAARRVVRLEHDGRPVADDDHFVVATNSYRAGGGGNFPGAGGDTVILEGPDSNRDVLLRYVTARAEIEIAHAPAWRFAALPGTSVLFETGPGAALHLDQLPGLDIEPVGTTAEGFIRFRLRL